MKVSEINNWYTRINKVLTKHGLVNLTNPGLVSKTTKISATVLNNIQAGINAQKYDEYLGTLTYGTMTTQTKGQKASQTAYNQIETNVKELETAICRNKITYSNGPCTNGSNDYLNHNNGDLVNGSKSNGSRSNGSLGNGTNSNGKNSTSTNSYGSFGNGGDSKGTKSNGGKSDGSYSNGSYSYGTNGNGYNYDGDHSNGDQSNGHDSNGDQSNEAQYNGTHVNGTNSLGTKDNGTHDQGTKIDVKNNKTTV